MPNIFMPIASAFAPNYTLRDVLIAGSYLLPWRKNELQAGENICRLEKSFASYMGVESAASFDSGRSGFYAILKAMGVGEGDEVILQAFTTVALANTIRFLGATPIFVDIDEDNFNIDTDLIEERITPATKAIVVQHTFGNPAQMDRILEIASKNGLRTIEDAAHALGAEFDGRKVGTFADAAFFSFGRDKVISAVAGGMVIAKDADLMKRIADIREQLAYPDRKTVMKNLLHPIVTFSALHTYNLFSIGKAAMYLAFRADILDKAYSKEEKEGIIREDFARRMPNALAALGLHQLGKADEFNEHRIRIARLYEKGIRNKDISLPQTGAGVKNIFLWYTIRVPEKDRLIGLAGEKNLVFGDWFPQAIGPIEVDLEKAGYEPDSCPVAEEVSRHCVNLPTHHNIHEKEAWKVINFVNDFK